MEGAAIGVDVGGTKLLAVAVDASGGVLDEVRLPTPVGGDGIVEAIAELGIDAPVLGLGVAGLVDRGGVLRIGPNLPGFTSYPFRDRLHERLGIAVTVDNDATTATWGELRVGAAAGTADALLVALGTGIGAGFVCGGVLQRGANGFAGEAGHMVVDPNGPACPCGKRGCWERFASGSGLGRLARNAAEAGRAPRHGRAGRRRRVGAGRARHAAAGTGDADALAVLREFGWWVALGVANLVNVLDPEVVVIGGGLAEMGDLLLDPVRERYADLVLAPAFRPAVPIVAAALGERAGAVGAALLAADALG